MMNGFYSSRNQTANSYVLRSASKGNVSKKQGVYSKFRNRSNLVNGFKQNETVHSRIEHLQASTNRIRQNDTVQSRIEDLPPSNNRERGFKQNVTEHSRIEHQQPSTSRAWQNDTARSRIEDPQLSSRECGLKQSVTEYSRIEHRQPSTCRAWQNDTARSRIEDLSPSTNGKRGVKQNILEASRIKHLQPPTSKAWQNDTARPRIDLQPSSNRERDQTGIPIQNRLSPPRNNHIRNHIGISMQNEQFSPPGNNQTRNEVCSDLSPRVVLKRIERDNDGFLIPSAPKLKSEEPKRSTKKALSELTDILPSAEAFYFVKRYEDILESFRKKVNPLLNGYANNPLLDRERKLQVVDWLQSATNSEAPLPVPASVISAIPREVLQDYAASVISAQTRPPLPSSQQWCKDTKTVYSLRDWTIVKGRAPIEVMVSGELRDISNQTLIEDGHVSSKILSADAVVVETSCCIYHLNGDFMDPSNCIPGNVKKHFLNGKFPKEWREVIRMWSILKDKENSLYVQGHNNGTSYVEAASGIDDGRRIRPRENDRMREMESERNNHQIRSRGEIRLHDIEDQKRLENEDQRKYDREGQRPRDREDQRIRDIEDRRIREKEQRIRDIEARRIREREDQRIREKEDQIIRDIEARRNRDRAEQRMHEQDNRINETPEQDNETIRERNERLHERDERVRFREIDSLQERNYGARRERGDNNLSQVSKKRKTVSEMEEESVVIRDVKRRRKDNVQQKKKLDTPGVTTRSLTVLTRSARRKMDSSYLCTPKSSKRNLLKMRRKTPMPPHRGRRLLQPQETSDSEASEIAFDNSDLM